MNLKRIDFNTGQFMANGTKYLIEGELTIERYAELQILQREIALEFSYKDFYNQLQDLYQLLNQQRFADCVVKVNDLIRGHAKVMEREPTVLKICALYINAENEDRTVFNQDISNKKISDWKTEGIFVGDFFTVASSSINGFLEIYQSVSRTISEGLGKLGEASR